MGEIIFDLINIYVHSQNGSKNIGDLEKTYPANQVFKLDKHVKDGQSGKSVSNWETQKG